MKILIDVMSGDNAPEALLRGAADASRSFPCDIAVIGDEKVISAVSHTAEIDISGLTVCHAEQVISMEDAPLSVLREKSNSSMALGLRMLAADEGDAFVSAGNTGALVAGATLVVRRIKGLRRAAIGMVMPFNPPFLLMDCGANLEMTPEDAVQFALLGGIYTEKILGRRAPRIGLFNIGTEATKGTEALREAYRLLTAHPNINFMGNIEARELPFSPCDVLVTDGFTGNAMLKLMEGMGSFMFSRLRSAVSSDLISKLGGAALKPKLRVIKKEFSASEYGGAPLLGISRPVIKAHGSSDAQAIKNAVRQAMAVVSSGVIPEMAKTAGALSVKTDIPGPQNA